VTAFAVLLSTVAVAPPCNWLGGPGNPFGSIGGCTSGSTFGCTLIESGPVGLACYNNGSQCCGCIYQDNTYVCFGIYVNMIREVTRISRPMAVCNGRRCVDIPE
jgi:hypothetical protein